LVKQKENGDRKE